MPFDVPAAAQHEREPAGFAATERPQGLHPAALVRPVVGADQFARRETEEMVRPEPDADGTDGLLRCGEDAEVDRLGDEAGGGAVAEGFEPVAVLDDRP
ncbi:hypothetical protein [Streptomyces sp. NPDC048295]|uniref:hypothetical protein n=1 Tax=Streptomyces sp. NPDC048295 TaxID=3154617 RepID=UPI0034398BA4